LPLAPSEFAEHREYASGDDLRYVDWKVYGKTDRIYLKQFEEALKSAGMDPDKDVEQLTVASYRNNKQTVKMVGVAQGLPRDPRVLVGHRHRAPDRRR